MTFANGWGHSQPELGLQAVMHYGESIKAIGNEVKLLPISFASCLPNAEVLCYLQACNTVLEH